MNTIRAYAAGVIGGLAALVFSAGSVFATNGYMTGDAAMHKLIPYYETGENRATLIAVQNLSPREAATTELHTELATARQGLANNTNPDLDHIAGLEQAIMDAEAALYTEHVFVSVNVHDEQGAMMGSAELCLAEKQFGYVILQGPEMQDWQEMDSHQNAILSVMTDDIPAMGYVQIMASETKYQGCVPVRGGIETVMTPASTPAMSRVATWAIIQDTGMGFFGTEVQSATISMASTPMLAEDTTDADNVLPAIPAGMPELACYSEESGVEPTRRSGADAGATAGTRGIAPYTRGDFVQTRCGLIPERHDNTRTVAGALETGAASADTDDGDVELDVADEVAATAMERENANTATPRGYAFARYDAGDETMVVVWLAQGMDTGDELPSMRRRLEVTVICSDGSAQMMQDADGNTSPIEIPAPTMLTTLDPNGMDLEPYTMMCPDNRGVLQIRMPDQSTAGMVFSHITQMGGHYRMNFPGYGMASPRTCYEIGQLDDDGVAATDDAAEAMAACE